MLRWDEQYRKISSYGICALAIIGVAVALRIVLVSKGWPLLDSDEGTMGLMAMHIAYRGEHPIFFYAQGYMGAFEAYLAAVMFRLFGISALALRFGLILIFAGFLTGMYLLTSLLYTKKLALFTLVLLSLGSNAILTRELVAVGGDPETLLCGAVLMLLALWLALTSHPDTATHYRGRRLLAYSVWGFTAGFGLWSHLLIIPFIAMSGLLLFAFCWRDLWSFAPLCIVVLLLIGALPLIIYNLHAAPGQDTLSYVLRVNSQYGISRPPFRILFPYQVKGALLISLPTATGANPLCPDVDVHLFAFGSLYAIRCTLVHTVWSGGFLILWTAAVILALAALWRLWYRAAGYPWSLQERQEVIRHCARLALLATVAITLSLYILSPSPALFPVATSRYLVGFLIVLPAVLWPLWNGISMVKPVAMRLSRVTVAVRLTWIGALLRGTLLLLIAAVFLLGMFSTFTGIPPTPGSPHEDVYTTQYTDQHLDVPAVQALNLQETALIHNLLRIGATRIYSDYWTCDRIIFQSHERIICSALKEHLEPGHDRYRPYHILVLSDPHASYVFHINSLQAITFAEHVAYSNRHRRFKRMIFDGYVVYQPRS